MNFENSKIKEVIDDFHKIGALDASFFRRFIDKALLLLLNENEGDLDKYREDIISAIIQVLKNRNQEMKRPPTLFMWCMPKGNIPSKTHSQQNKNCIK